MIQPLVTVVIPIYNVEDYLDRCVQSVVNQTYCNLEIILVDDGSPDGCPQMCDEWAKRDSRIRAIHKNNSGLGLARNTGIENANGEYIFFFDSDDYVSEDIVFECVRSAQENNADAVVFGIYDVYEDGTKEERNLNLPDLVYGKNDICQKLLPKMFTYDYGFGISAWGKMYKLSAITDNQVAFKSERDVISEDALFALEFYPKITTFAAVNKCLYYYCKRGDSLSRVYNPERQNKNDDFIMQACRYIQDEGLSADLLNHLTVRYHMYTVAAIKQLMMSDLSNIDKKRQLYNIFKSAVLHTTLSKEVIKLHKTASKLLFTLLKYKMYSLCVLLICLKMSK